MSAISALKLRFAKQSDQIVPQPKAEEASTGRRKATEEQSKLLRNLLWNVEFDENRKAVLIDPRFADPALPDQFVGAWVTYGDLKRLRLAAAMRPNGTVGPHYPLTSSIDSDQAESLIDYLDGRPKADRSKSRRKAAPKAQPAKPVAAESSELSDKVAQLQSDFSTLIDLLPQIIKEAGQTAKPSEGHTKVEAAEPPQVEVTGPVYRAGDVIWVELSDGTVAQRQLSSDAKRLNVTIV